MPASNVEAKSAEKDVTEKPNQKEEPKAAPAPAVPVEATKLTTPGSQGMYNSLISRLSSFLALITFIETAPEASSVTPQSVAPSTSSWTKDVVASASAAAAAVEAPKEEAEKKPTEATEYPVQPAPRAVPEIVSEPTPKTGTETAPKEIKEPSTAPREPEAKPQAPSAPASTAGPNKEIDTSKATSTTGSVSEQPAASLAPPQQKSRAPEADMTSIKSVPRSIGSVSGPQKESIFRAIWRIVFVEFFGSIFGLKKKNRNTSQ